MKPARWTVPTGLPHPLARLAGACNAIVSCQTQHGAIMWFDDGPWDAWNHCEGLMALTVMGHHDAAATALGFLAASQAADGSWLGEYGNALPMDAANRKLQRISGPVIRDTNFIAYVATAVWHSYLTRPSRRMADQFWPMVRDAIEAVLRCQHPQGDISWCVEAHGEAGDNALLAGNASIFASLGHAILLGTVVGERRTDWLAARHRLASCILHSPERFDREAKDRSGFAMDWYYPVLTGVLAQSEAKHRIDAGHGRFIAEGLGCRCVDDQPWVTVAESAELAMALLNIGARDEAARVLEWQDAQRDADGAYWMGWQYDLEIAWPVEKPSWTQAAMILATDALHAVTPASRVLTG